MVVGSRVAIDATASGFGTPTPSFEWSLETVPAGSLATLSSETGSATELLVDVVGDYEVSVRAVDDGGDATASVTVSAVVPVEGRVAIDPIPDQVVAQASTLRVPLRVTGDDLEGVELVARSSFQRLVQDAAMLVEGNGASRHLTIRANWLAETTGPITMSVDVIAVRNDTELDVRTFALDVTPPFATAPARLGPPAVDPVARFGHAIAIHQGRVVVGAPTTADSLDSGSAHVYLLSDQGWLHEATLVPDEGAPRHSFGSAVAIHGDVVVVGAPYTSGASEERGEAFVFQMVDGVWERRQRLTAGLLATEWDAFGISVAVTEGAIAVGAPVLVGEIGNPGFGYDGRREGLAHMYRHDGDRWVRNGLLHAPLWPGDNWFGSALAIHEGRLVVSAPGARVERDGQVWPVGMVMHFQESAHGWTPIGHIEGTGGARFLGSSLALESNASVVGFSQPPQPEQGFFDYSGAVAVFSHDDEGLQTVSLLAGEESAWSTNVSTALESGLLIVGEGANCRRCATSTVEVFLPREDDSGWARAASLHLALSDRPTDHRDDFGAAIAIGTHHVLVTAPGQSLVYVFPR